MPNSKSFKLSERADDATQTLSFEYTRIDLVIWKH